MLHLIHELMSNRKLRWVPLLFLALVGGYLIWKYPHFVIDDAFITARYAQNLAYHGELTWNLGENPVEGYTGVLLPVLLAGLMRLTDLDFIAMPLIYGMAGFIAGGFFLWWILNRVQAPVSLQLGFMALYALAPCIHPHIFAGLETFIFIALTGAATWQLFELLRNVKDVKGGGLAVTLLLAALTRPEGIGLALIYFSAALWWIWKQAPDRLAGFLRRALLICGLPWVLYFAWRWQYYGYLLPNTYYIKQTFGTNWIVLEKFLLFTRLYLTVPLLMVLTGAALIWRPFRRKRRASEGTGDAAQPVQWPWLLGAAVFGYIASTLVVYLRSQLSMDYAFRFFVPFYLPLLMLAGILAGMGYKTLANPSRWRWIYPSLFGLVCLGWSVGVFMPEYFYEKALAKAYLALIASEHIQAGVALRELIPPGERLAVVVDAGAVPYYSELPSIDIGGLNDEYIAHGSLRPMDIIEYMFGMNPGALAMVSYSADYFTRNGSMDEIVSHPGMEKYELYKIYKSPLKTNNYYGRYYLYVYIRSDLLGSD